MASALSPEERRKISVQRILEDQFTLNVEFEEIERLDRGFNNHLYTVNLLPDTRSSRERVQNEVAALAFVRQPLASLVRVPEVYAWSEGRGTDETPFIIMELLPRKPLDKIWPLLDLPSRLPILSQIADILGALRSFQLPVPNTPCNYTFGGLAFSALGSITTAMHPNSIGGPFTSAEGQWLSMLSSQIRCADDNRFIQGWKSSDLRGRLDSFIDNDEGFRGLLRQVATEPVFIHGDFNCRNFLVCPDTHRMTGLLDFEFARIGTAPEELIDGLEDFRDHACVEPSPDGLDLHLLESKGWPCQISSNPVELGCETARAWKNLVQLPIEGYGATVKTYTFLDKLCPWYFCQEPWCNAHGMVAERRIAESSLSDLLAAWGF
ncbi:kinase-like domain-containing protein [Mycena rosella]|uniref:Kinase-like domain-containing protein n=1 Tax=Mycena rosella TaxID=1033263 RepID=A0AAD7G8G0_MYCRO|nr:kinase-like domain-containing protein [Mycena rosella]